MPGLACKKRGRALDLAGVVSEGKDDGEKKRTNLIPMWWCFRSSCPTRPLLKNEKPDKPDRAYYVDVDIQKNKQSH